MGRRFLLIPTVEEQQYASFHGCLYTAATFTTRNYVAGDYLEFGVWEGNSFIKAYHATLEMRRQHSAWLQRHPTHSSEHGKATSPFEQWKHWSPRFFAFDSFAGLPASGDQMQEEWAKGSYQCPEDRFRANLASERVNPKAVMTLPRFLDVSLTPKDQAAAWTSPGRHCPHRLRSLRIYHPGAGFYYRRGGAGNGPDFRRLVFQSGPQGSREPQASREWLGRNPNWK